MCNLACSVVSTVIGAIMVIASCLIGFLLVPNLVENIIINEVVLLDDTIQFERFEQVPFPLQFSFMVFTISNPEEVLNGGIPVMVEVGPYVYKLYQARNVTFAEDDIMRYHRVDKFVFDAEASYPRTEDDLVTMINVPYHAIIQIAQESFPTLAPILNPAMNGIFGSNNSPIMTVRAGDLFFDGVRICVNPGFLASVACSIITQIAAQTQNLVGQPDGSLLFSLLDYSSIESGRVVMTCKCVPIDFFMNYLDEVPLMCATFKEDGSKRNEKPSVEYEIKRGIEDPSQLGLIKSMDGLGHFLYWIGASEDDPGLCNMINGTDAGIFAPFVDAEKSIYAINTDICRSVELRYQYDVDVDGIPVKYFSTNEWFMDNHEGCFCLNVTRGINREDGCLLSGAMELYTCVGAMLVLSYPHFLYADSRYRNGVIGMRPVDQHHRLFIEIEPNTGTPVRGAKRAQFNIFQRPISSIPPTSQLRTELVPIVWVEESIDLPEEYKDELRNRLLGPLNLVDILIPVLIAASCVVLVIGLFCVCRAMRGRKSSTSRTD